METYLMIKVLHCLHNCFNRTQTKLLLNFFKKTPISTQKSNINTYLRRPKIVLKGNIIELGVTCHPELDEGKQRTLSPKKLKNNGKRNHWLC
jgi:hypothetical protein